MLPVTTIPKIHRVAVITFVLGILAWFPARAVATGLSLPVGVVYENNFYHQFGLSASVAHERLLNAHPRLTVSVTTSRLSAFAGKNVLKKENVLFSAGWYFRPGRLIDPIVVPSSKLLHIVNVVGPMLGNSPVEHTAEIEKRHWYTNRPASTLAELNELIERVRGKLEDGFSLPDGTRLKCYKADVDDSADPVSALLIYKGVTDADGSKVEVEMVRSDYHVFTQLAARTNATGTDYQLQQRVFTEMADRMVAH